MEGEPTKAYVYQPFPPQADGKSYGVGGLTAFGLDYDDADIRGIDRDTAREIVRVVNENPGFACSLVRGFRENLDI